MIRSMSAAVTGLRGHQQKLDVIGNNIANVNTVGFKKSQARFEDLISQTIQGATAPLEDRGGINPSQVGLGMKVSSITDIHSQGAITSTDRITDLAIEGEGYFIVTDVPGSGNRFYTRDGSFGLDANGNIVNDNGLYLSNFATNNITIPIGDDMVAQATGEMRFAGNLDARGYQDATEGSALFNVPLEDADLVAMNDLVTFGVAVDGGAVQFVSLDMSAINTQQAMANAINAQVAGAGAEFDGNLLTISSTTAGDNSSVEIFDVTATALFGAVPQTGFGVNGTPATAGSVVGDLVLTDADINNLDQVVNITLTVDGNPENINLNMDDVDNITELLTALNNALTGAVADVNDSDQLRVTSSTTGAASSVSIDFSDPDVQVLFGATGTESLGQDAIPAEPGIITGQALLTDLAIEELTGPVRLAVAVDGGAEQQIDLNMNNYDTQAALLGAINAQLNGANASFEGNNLVITSGTTGNASSVILRDDSLFGDTFAGNIATEAGSDAVIREHQYEYYVFDSLGRRNNIDFTFTPVDYNVWEYNLTVTDEGGNIIEVDGGGNGMLVFDQNGGLIPGDSNIPDIEFNPPGEAAPMAVTPDFGAATQLAGLNSLLARAQDGFAAGTLAGFNIERTGLVVGTYTNGLTEEFGQIETATFPNPEGLAKQGGNLYRETVNSGEAAAGVPGGAGRGLIQSSALELSNTDLAYEFTELITTSRAFQANTRVITTSDEILTEVVNMKR